jgi:hypothetical protein
MLQLVRLLNPSVEALYGSARRMALTAARKNGWRGRVSVDETPRSAWIFVGTDGDSVESLRNTSVDPEIRSESLEARLQVMGARLKARVALTGESCVCAVPVGVFTITGMVQDDSAHATVLVLHLAPESSGTIRWAYYDPHGAHADDVAQARFNVGRLCASLGYLEMPCRVLGRTWESSVQTDLPLCMFYMWLFVYTLAYNGPDSVADVLSQFHDPECVAQVSAVIMRRWVPEMLWQCHKRVKRKELGVGSAVSLGWSEQTQMTTAVFSVKSKLCRKTRTYQVADQFGVVRPVPFIWVVPKHWVPHPR